MLKRCLTGAAIVLVLIGLLFVAGTPVFGGVFSLVAVIGCFEMLRCLGVHRKLYLSVPILLYAAVMPVGMTIYGGELMANGAQVAKCYLFMTLVLLLYLFGVALFAHHSLTTEQIMTAFALCFYIIGAMSCIVYLSCVRYGKYIWGVVFLGAWVTDVFALFSGMLFGKHKLSPEISPKKTIEGSIGGSLFGTVAVVIYGAVVNWFFDASFHLILLALAGFLMTVVGQIGDLLLSLIKRQYHIKDYGRILPGHGGILDRFDSAMAVAVVFAAFIVFVPLVH